MSDIKLSILICSVPQRLEHLDILIHELHRQIDAGAVEVIYLGDLGTMSPHSMTIGAKRNALMSIARGRYITYVDDDDYVYNHPVRYVDALLYEIGQCPDVSLITFNTMITWKGKLVPVRFSVDNENENQPPKHFLRRPHHLMCWRRELVKDIPFEDCSMGEDHDWGERATERIKGMTVVELPDFLYQHNSDPERSMSVMRYKLGYG